MSNSSLSYSDVQKLFDSGVFNTLPDLLEQVKRMPKYSSGTVKSVDPLSVQVDGDEEVLPYEPVVIAGIKIATVGTRVVMLYWNKKYYVLSPEGSDGELTIGGDAAIDGELTLGTPLAITEGGTGATDSAGARSALGLGAAALLGSPIPVANGGTGATNAAGARTNLHAQQAAEEVTEMELGNNRTVAGPAFIDFHTRAQPAVDYDTRLIAWSSGDFNIQTGGNIGLYPGSGRSVLINDKAINALATKKVLMGTVVSTGGMPNSAGQSWRWTNTQTQAYGHTFSSLPVILACVCTTSGISTMAVTSKRLDAFDWRAFEYGSADAGRNVTINWIAIGD